MVHRAARPSSHFLCLFRHLNLWPHSHKLPSSALQAKAKKISMDHLLNSACVLGGRLIPDSSHAEYSGAHMLGAILCRYTHTYNVGGCQTHTCTVLGGAKPLLLWLSISFLNIADEGLRVWRIRADNEKLSVFPEAAGQRGKWQSASTVCVCCAHWQGAS